MESRNLDLGDFKDYEMEKSEFDTLESQPLTIDNLKKDFNEKEWLNVKDREPAIYEFKSSEIDSIDSLKKKVEDSIEMFVHLEDKYNLYKFSYKILATPVEENQDGK